MKMLRVYQKTNLFKRIPWEGTKKTKKNNLLESSGAKICKNSKRLVFLVPSRGFGLKRLVFLVPLEVLGPSEAETSRGYQKNQYFRILAEFSSWRLQKIGFFGFFGTLSRFWVEKIGFFGTLSRFGGFQKQKPREGTKKTNLWNSKPREGTKKTKKTNLLRSWRDSRAEFSKRLVFLVPSRGFGLKRLVFLVPSRGFCF